jgi:outer membrane protein assembly complex protein YaeT
LPDSSLKYVPVAVLLALACLCAAAIAADETAPIVYDIRFEGNGRMSDSAMLALVRTRAGQPYSEAELREDEKRLSDSGRFESVAAARTYTDEGVVVTFTVVERPLIASVRFEGNTVFTAKELAKELGFGESEPLNLYKIEAGRQSILDKYRQKGYAEATVDVDAAKLRSTGEVVYRIDQGIKTVLTKIRFEGNHYFSSFRLGRAIGSKARFWPFVQGTLDTQQADDDVHRLVNLHVDEGFLDVKVARELSFNKKRTKAVLRFIIDEGPRFRVNRVAFEGNTVFSGEELARQLSLHRGEHFTALRLRRDLDRIRAVYGEVGYIDADVTASRVFLPPGAPVPDWAADLDKGRPALLDLVFHMDQDGQYRISGVAVRGNTVTQDRVIRRQLLFFPEQLVNMAAVNESQLRLKETGLFSDVSITPADSGPGTKEMVVNVEEGQTANFLIGAGVNTNAGLVGTVSFTQRNFDITAWPTSRRDVTSGRAWKGAGQTFSIVAEPGTELMRLQMSWFEPYLFDKPYSLGTKAYLFTRERESYDETRYGGQVSLGHRFLNDWYGELASTVEGVRISDIGTTYIAARDSDGNLILDGEGNVVRIPIPDAPPEVVADEGTHTLVSAKGTLVKDRTDSRWMPSAGDRIRLSYEQVGGDYCFGRAEADYRIYRTIYMDSQDRKHIWSGRLFVGKILGNSPVFENYYGGGLGSLRGFDYRGISPRTRGLVIDQDIAEPDEFGEHVDKRTIYNDDPIGGAFYVYAGTEYTFPLIGEQLRGVVFLDSGTVEQNCQLGVYRVSAGAGLRWHIPALGPIPMSLEFGFPVHKDDQDDTQLLSFSLGWTF